MLTWRSCTALWALSRLSGGRCGQGLEAVAQGGPSDLARLRLTNVRPASSCARFPRDVRRRLLRIASEHQLAPSFACCDGTGCSRTRPTTPRSLGRDVTRPRRHHECGGPGSQCPGATRRAPRTTDRACPIRALGDCPRHAPGPPRRLRPPRQRRRGGEQPRRPRTARPLRAPAAIAQERLTRTGNGRVLLTLKAEWR